MRSNTSEALTLGGFAVVGLLIVSGLVAVSAWGCPQYRVYVARMDGQANLQHAEQTRQILVTQAQAERDAAKLRAEAIGIVGEAAKKYPEYRQQEFIGAFADALKDGNISQIIYVPTEASIPLIEAGRIAATATK